MSYIEIDMLYINSTSIYCNLMFDISVINEVSFNVWMWGMLRSSVAYTEWNKACIKKSRNQSGRYGIKCPGHGIYLRLLEWKKVHYFLF